MGTGHNLDHLPRQGQYELFISADHIYCFDDLDHVKWPNNEQTQSWLAKQNSVLCRAYRTQENNKPSAYYLDPKLYFMWKLAWSEHAKSVRI